MSITTLDQSSKAAWTKWQQGPVQQSEKQDTAGCMCMHPPAGACLCARPAQVLGGLGGAGGRHVQAVARRQEDSVLRGRKAPVVAVICASLGRVLHLHVPHQRRRVSTSPQIWPYMLSVTRAVVG